MIRSRRAVQVLLLTGIIASGAFAAPLAYTINFIPTFGSPTPTGSFTYDSALPDGTQFSSFLVNWDGITFGFLTQANSGGASVGCALGASIVIFDVMSNAAECPGTPNSLFWQADSLSTSDFNLRDIGNPGSGHNITLDQSAGAGTIPTSASGSWSITENDAPPTPEPSSFILALAGGALLMLNRRRPSTRICL